MNQTVRHFTSNTLLRYESRKDLISHKVPVLAWRFYIWYGQTLIGMRPRLSLMPNFFDIFWMSLPRDVLFPSVWQRAMS
jgi:hypothetical protein